MIDQSIAERIQQRRVQMLVHSYLYYELDTSVVPDDTWQSWANELAALQAQHSAACTFYEDAFEDWDGTTGMHLPRDEWVRENALRLLRVIERGHSRPEPEKTPPAPAARAPELFSRTRKEPETPQLALF